MSDNRRTKRTFEWYLCNVKRRLERLPSRLKDSHAHPKATWKVPSSESKKKEALPDELIERRNEVIIIQPP